MFQQFEQKLKRDWKARAPINTSTTYLPLVFAVILGVCLLFPYTGDDWAWGSSIGLERLRSGFANYNGRYLGNIIVLILTRSSFARSIVIAASLTLMPFLICRLVGKSDFPTYCVALTLILLMPKGEAAQAIAWTSGFTNYCIPTLGLLTYLNICRIDLFPRNAEEGGYLTGFALPGVFALGLANSLIMENVTLLNVSASAFLIPLIYLRKRTISKSQVAFFTGSVIAAAIMFSNGAYGLAVSENSGYQSASIGYLKQRLNAFPYLLVTQHWSIFAFSLAATVLNLQKRKTSRRTQLFASALLCAILALCLYAYFHTQGNSQNKPLDFASGGALLLSLMFLACFYFGTEKCVESKMAICLALIIGLLIAPLTVVNPIGPRNFLAPYVLECAIACLVWITFTKGTKELPMKLFLLIALTAALSRWMIAYYPIHLADVERNNAIEIGLSTQNSTITLNPLPSNGWVHCPDPTEGLWEERFKLFHNIPDEYDIELRQQ